METLIANYSVAKVRFTRFEGKEYLIAPLAMINPGVLNGSKGKLYYPPSEVRRNPDQWNGIPLVVYHPQVNGTPVSARSPSVLEKFCVGQVFNATISPKGKLVGEGWFDVSKTQKVDPRILESLRQGRKIELSTGLFTDNEEAPEGANDNGKPYDFIARNYRPDHLAILPDQKGACSLKDGCGVLVNKLTENDFSPESRQAALLKRKQNSLGNPRGRFSAKRMSKAAKGSTEHASKYKGQVYKQGTPTKPAVQPRSVRNPEKVSRSKALHELVQKRIDAIKLKRAELAKTKAPVSVVKNVAYMTAEELITNLFDDSQPELVVNFWSKAARLAAIAARKGGKRTIAGLKQHLRSKLAPHIDRLVQKIQGVASKSSSRISKGVNKVAEKIGGTSAKHLATKINRKVSKTAAKASNKVTDAIHRLTKSGKVAKPEATKLKEKDFVKQRSATKSKSPERKTNPKGEAPTKLRYTTDKRNLKGASQLRAEHEQRKQAAREHVVKKAQSKIEMLKGKLAKVQGKA